MRKSIITKSAPQPAGPYSQGALAGTLQFVAGQIPIDPRIGDITQPDIRMHAKQVVSLLSGEMGIGSL